MCEKVFLCLLFVRFQVSKMAWKRGEGTALARVWDMTGVATVEERSYADDNLRIDKGGNEGCEH